MASSIGPAGSLKTRLVNPKRSRLFSVHIPGVGTVGFTRDHGQADLFATSIYRTRLSSRVLSPEGDLLAEAEHGAGKVTNVGVLALAQDGTLTIGVSGAPANLLTNVKFHAWGGSSTAVATTDIKLTEPKKPTETEAVEGTNVLVTSGTGAPKLKSSGKIKAESTFEVKEWGIFTQKKLEATTGTPLTAKNATTGTTTGTALTASSTTAKGETLKILAASESESAGETWGLITSNTTSVVTVPAWYKQSTGATDEPKATSPYVLRPVMFDHIVISPISVESGNEVEFVFELELPSGS